ncbi:tripartite tricarboxylate transporter TctB family protein [Micromonospora deserti]|nr:tripartite tricarboxylate transporter TctB family protein [Micromonospora deserti]
MRTRPDPGGDRPSPPVPATEPAIPDQLAPPVPQTVARAGAPASPAGDTGSVAPPARAGDRAQYGVCVFLAVLGALVIVDATGIGRGISIADPIGPKPVPILLGVLLLIVAAVYAVDVARGGTGEPEAGEDVDLSSPIDWRTVLLLIGAFLANAVLIDRLGWVISGTLLFWGSAFALGNRHYVRSLLIAVALSLTTFYTFAIGLGVNLPAGVLQGIL